jgi:hypothetical protein
MIAAICAVPLLCEALTSALDGIAEVQSFPAGREDTDGLLRSLQPDGIVVDNRTGAGEAEAYARASHAPLVHVQLSEQNLRVLTHGSWEIVADASPESIRNVLVGSLYGPRTVTA